MKLTPKGPEGLREHVTPSDRKQREIYRRQEELLIPQAAEAYLKPFKGQFHEDFREALQVEREVAVPTQHVVAEREIEEYAPELLDEWRTAIATITQTYTDPAYSNAQNEDDILPEGLGEVSGATNSWKMEIAQPNKLGHETFAHTGEGLVSSGPSWDVCFRVENIVRDRRYPDKKAAVEDYAYARGGQPPVHVFLNSYWGEKNEFYTDRTLGLTIAALDEIIVTKFGGATALTPVFSDAQGPPIGRAIIRGLPGAEGIRRGLLDRLKNSPDVKRMLALDPGTTLMDVELASIDWMSALSMGQTRALFTVLQTLTGHYSHDGRRIKGVVYTWKWADFKRLVGLTSNSATHGLRLMEAIDSLSRIHVPIALTGTTQTASGKTEESVVVFDEPLLKRAWKFADQGDAILHAKGNMKGKAWKGAQPTHITVMGLHPALQNIEAALFTTAEFWDRLDSAAKRAGHRDSSYTFRLYLIIASRFQKHHIAPNGQPYSYIHRDKYLDEVHGAATVEARRKKDGAQHRFLKQYLSAVKGLHEEGLIEIVELEYQGTTGVLDRFALPVDAAAGGVFTHTLLADPDQLSLPGMTDDPPKKAKRKKKKQ